MREAATPEGRVLWEPSSRRRQDAGVTRFCEWLTAERGLSFDSTEDLWAWSVSDPNAFWDATWDFCAVRGERGDGPALADATMPGARWFPGATLNYAENALTRGGRAPAIVAVREDATTTVVSWNDLRAAVGAATAGLRRLGVTEGDRVCAVLPNGVHAVVAMLATASLGAVWSCCSPDFGATGLSDRFAQIAPTVLIGTDGYLHAGRTYDTLGTLAALTNALPSLRATVVVPGLDETAAARATDAGVPGVVDWVDLVAEPAAPSFTPMPFDAPLWIVYSSGTTGLPKALVHSHGGILVEHLKALALHLDLGPDDRFSWFTGAGSTAWHMLMSGLLVGSTLVLFDGSADEPDLGTLWRLADAVEITCFGADASYLASCAAADLLPREIANLAPLRTIVSTGSMLPPDVFAWVYEAVADDVMLLSISGGSDVCTAFALGMPTLPVRAGESGMRSLGCAVAVLDDAGHEIVDEIGELVVTAPMPSMPLMLWGDDDGSRMRDSYFTTYAGVWRQGDRAKITPFGSVVVYGPSDATLNRGGLRTGTTELYRVVEAVPGVADALAVETGTTSREGVLLLFVELDDGVELTDALTGRINAAISNGLDPRHVPDRITQVGEIPRTHNGKKLEVPIRRLLLGEPLSLSVSLPAVANPEALLPFMSLR